MPPRGATAPGSITLRAPHGGNSQENRALAAGWALRSVSGGWWKAPLALRKPWEAFLTRGWLHSVWEVAPKPSHRPSPPGCSLDSYGNPLPAVLAEEVRLSLIKMHCSVPPGLGQSSRAPSRADAASLVIIRELLFPSGRSHSTHGWGAAGPIPPGSRDVRGNGMGMRCCWRHEWQIVISLPLLSSLRIVYSRTKETEGRELPTVPRVAILLLMGHVKPICSSELRFLTIFLRPRQR